MEPVASLEGGMLADDVSGLDASAIELLHKADLQGGKLEVLVAKVVI